MTCPGFTWRMNRSTGLARRSAYSGTGPCTAASGRPIYITGDTVWYDGVADVARRYHAGLVLLFAGAAKTRGSFHLTMSTNDAIDTAHAFADATIVPLHYEGWAHFSENADDLAQSFKALGIAGRLRLLEPGVATTIEMA